MEFPTTAEAIYITSAAVALVVAEKVLTQRLLNRQRQELKSLLEEWQGLVALFKALRQQREAAERQKSELRLRKAKIEQQLIHLRDQIEAQEEKERRQSQMAAELDKLIEQP
jgi:cysteine sulfinate desulfinase/cysteine desulfurase-like protein